MSRSGESEKQGDGSPPPSSALARLVETEERLDRAVAAARREAEALVEAAREEARTILDGVEEELDRQAAGIRARVERRVRPDAAAVEEDADRRVEAWDGLTEDEVGELADRVVRDVVRRQGESPSGGRG